MAIGNVNDRPRYSLGDWCEKWIGSKQQLQSVGIGVGMAFPGEARAPKKRVETVDRSGFHIVIEKASAYYDHKASKYCDYPEGTYEARSRYVEPIEHLEPAVPYAEGVTLVRGLYGRDYFKGTGAALVACGLIEDAMLPGRDGRPKVSCSYNPDGSPRVRGAPDSDWRHPGAKQIRRNGPDKFEISMAVSKEEKERRGALLELKDKDRRVEQHAVMLARMEFRRRAEAERLGQIPRKMPSTWRVIVNPGWKASSKEQVSHV